MIKATAKMPDGRTMLALGLSFSNLDKFRAEPMDTFIKINGKEMGLPIDVLIFSGETEAHMTDMMLKYTNKNTIVHVDPKLKS
jgi:hypothetical protein